MHPYRSHIPATFPLIITALLLCATRADAQSTGITASPLMRTTLSDDETKEVLVLSVEFAPGGTTGRHIHPGDEYATVLEGVLEIRVDGQEPRRVKGGEAYHNPRGIIHETRNVGEMPARLVTTFVIDRGKPVSEPVP